MKVLAIETAGDACSVALLCGDDCIERIQRGSRGHSQLLLPMVESVLAEAGIALGECDAIAYGKGPGSFTGLRIGVGVTQGLAYGAGLPVIGVSSLAALAWQAGEPIVLACIDARMDQVYWGSYRRTESNSVQLVGSESVSDPDHVRAEPICWGVGSGWDAYSQRLTNAVGDALRGWSPDCVPLARATARIAVLQAGEATKAQLASPEYIRNTVTRG